MGGLAAAVLGIVSLALRGWQYVAAIGMVVAGTIVLAVAGYDTGHNWRREFSVEHFSADQVDVTISLWISLVLGLMLCFGGLTMLVLRNRTPRQFQTDAAHP